MDLLMAAREPWRRERYLHPQGTARLGSALHAASNLLKTGSQSDSGSSESIAEPLVGYIVSFVQSLCTFNKCPVCGGGEESSSVSQVFKASKSSANPPQSVSNQGALGNTW